LPFLHPPTFQNIFFQAKGVPAIQDFNTPRQDTSQSLPPAAPEFLLAFLALTSKYQSNLITHHSSRAHNPNAAAEYYATACKHRLAMTEGQSHRGVPPSLSRVQTYLMLTLYEWSNCEGLEAWGHLTKAIQEARMIGLSDGLAERALLKNSIIRPLPLGTLVLAQGPETEEETKKRTFWACFVMERFLASGRYRPLSFAAQNTRVSLPISQSAFLFSKSVRTLLFSQSCDALKYLNGLSNSSTDTATSSNIFNEEGADAEMPVESGQSEGILSRYVKAAEVFNAVVQWACAGGRL
jgi:transcription factor-like protein